MVRPWKAPRKARIIRNHLIRVKRRKKTTNFIFFEKKNPQKEGRTSEARFFLLDVKLLNGI
jgi:hypothetical protein